MVKNSVVLMTALVPTIGHIELIKFALGMTENKVTVLVQARSFEPVDGYRRALGIERSFDNIELGEIDVIHIGDDRAPQNPDPALETEPGADREFWQYWVDSIRENSDVGRDFEDAIIASEPYGAVLAKKMGIQFVPYDIKREIIPVKGTDVRADLDGEWNNVAPGFRRFLKTNVVIFGQESVGKTTMARELCARDELNHQHFIPEYARGYLEAVGADLSDHKMRMIAAGQRVLQENAEEYLYKHTNIFDTDLLSTIGYHLIQGNAPEKIDPYIIAHYKNWLTYGKPVYFLMPDDIPFEEDQLRYGGDKRESTYGFWLNLLNKYNCEYHLVPHGLDFDGKHKWIQERIDDHTTRKFESIRLFERE